MLLTKVRRCLTVLCTFILTCQAIQEQHVLKDDAQRSELVENALTKLKPFQKPDVQFGPLHYDEILAGKEADSRPKLNLYVDFNWNLRKNQYKVDMDNLHGDQQIALSELLEAAEADDATALELLGDIHMFGNYSIPRNGSMAFEFYKRLADVTKTNGNAHFMLGFIYATGLYGEVEQSQAKALIHYQAAHELGDLRATMALAYRYYAGISVQQSCQTALLYYSAIAQRSVKAITDGPIGGPNLDSYAVRIADFHGGLYGSRASEQPSSLTRSFSDYLYERDALFEVDMDPEYYKPAQLLYEAKAYYSADYFHSRDYEAGFESAQRCAVNGERWILDNPLNKLFVSRCYALLGHMYLRGEGTTQNYTEAMKWLTKATTLSTKATSQVDLGLMYEFGLGIQEAEPKKAMAMYQNAKHDSNAKFHMARHILKENKQKGMELMQISAYAGNEQALYHLATLYEKDVGAGRTCEEAVAPYKAFVERMEPLHPILEWSFKQLFSEGDNELALIGYGMAAEQGFESAQASAAFLLYSPVPISENLPKLPKERFEAAITYYARSAKQYNIDSAVFLGDLYYYGVRSPELDDDAILIAPDYKRAFHYYQDASNKHSRQGSFNAGYMYEAGLGVPRDYHLAKRYYDLALLGKSSDAYLPVQLALFKLKAKMFWNRLVGGNSIEDEYISEEIKPRTWNDWVDWYKRIKQTNRQFLSGNEELVPLSVTEEAQLPEYDDYADGIVDIAVVVLIVGAFVSAMILQNRLRRRREQNEGNGNDGDNDGANVRPPPNVQFNFMIIPL